MNKCAGKRLLVLGATRLIAEIVKEAKKYGAWVAVVDYSRDSYAKRFADESILRDATDVDFLVQYVNENRIDGVLTGFTDSLLPAYYQICKRTGRPCYLNDLSMSFTLNKSFFKDKCREFDIPVIREYKDGERAEFPLIVKPVDNSGARGISVCRNDAELLPARDMALRFSKSKTLLIEDYVDCQEATAFYIFSQGRAMFAALADRHVAPVKDGYIRLPTGYTFPSPCTANFLQDTHPKFCRLFESLGIQNGQMFIQGFLTKDRGFVPYEPGFRPTGSLENQVFARTCGYSNIAMLVNFALTGSMGSDDELDRINPKIVPRSYNISFLIRPGKISKVEGVERLRALRGVVYAFQSYAEGDVLSEDAWGRLSQIFLRVIVCGGESAYAEAVSCARENLHVWDDDGREMLINFGIEEGRLA